MSKSISANAGRLYLVVIMLATFLASIVSLISITSNQSEDQFALRQSAITELMAIHIPPTMLVIAFFLGERVGKRDRDRPTSLVLWVGAAVCGLVWFSLPSLMFNMRYGIAASLADLQIIKPAADALILAVFGLYLSRD